MIGVYGGSFDPPHIGHLGVMKAFWKFFPESKSLLLVPNYISPFKKSKGAKEADVIAMLDLLLSEANLNKTIIEDYEIKKKTTSYTIDTLRFIKERNNNEEIYLLLGVDNLKNFSSWKNFEEILANAKILIFDREWDKEKFIPSELRPFWDRFIFLENSPIKASSSEIRKLSYDKWISFVSPKVLDYIKENELYGFRKGN